jgi:hypothetical protein
MNARFKQVLDQSGVGIGIKGSREKPIRREALSDMFMANEADKTRVLTKHGAHLVFKSVSGQRVSYKDLGAALFQEAQRIVAESEERHRLEIEAFVKNTRQLPDAQAPTQLAAPAEASSEEPTGTAGN